MSNTTCMRCDNALVPNSNLDKCYSCALVPNCLHRGCKNKIICGLIEKPMSSTGSYFVLTPHTCLKHVDLWIPNSRLKMFETYAEVKKYRDEFEENYQMHCEQWKATYNKY